MDTTTLLDQHKAELLQLRRTSSINAIKRGREIAANAGIDSSLLTVKNYIDTLSILERCPSGSHTHGESVFGPHVIKRNYKEFTNSYFAACDEHKHLYKAPDYTLIIDNNKEEKKMPARQYGINQKMIARFPGRCFLCSLRIAEGVDLILPVLSERTPRGRHPWVHEACFKNDLDGKAITTPDVVEENEDTPLPQQPSRFLVDPPQVSQRQLNVIAKNLEAVLKALAANPAQAYALVPTNGDQVEGAIVTTEVMQPQPKAESASA